MKTTVTITRATIEFTPARRFRDSIAEGRASGTMRLSGATVLDGRRVTLSVRFAAPVEGLGVMSPVYDDGSPVIGQIRLRNPEGDLDCVRVTPEGVPEESLTGPDGEAVPASSVCCWVALGLGSASMEVDNLTEPKERESGVFVDADLAGGIAFERPIDPFGGRVAGIRSVPVFGPTARMVEAAERRRATRQAAAAASSDVAF